ncbi:MAG: nucleoside/nucleotide kinase family protein [Devosia sp.]
MIGPERLSLSFDAALAHLAERALPLVGPGTSRRAVLGIAGGPGTGKSTLAQALLARLDEQAPGMAALVPLDGFHMRQDKLVALGLADRKGAHETFEAEAFIRTLAELREAQTERTLPVYSRAIEDVVDDGLVVPASARMLIAEGNYLLMATAPWWPILPLLDLAVHLDLPREAVVRRLAIRHAEHGLFTADQIARHIDSVDLPNYDRVNRCRGRAHLVFALAP